MEGFKVANSSRSQAIATRDFMVGCFARDIPATISREQSQVETGPSVDGRKPAEIALGGFFFWHEASRQFPTRARIASRKLPTALSEAAYWSTDGFTT